MIYVLMISGYGKEQTGTQVSGIRECSPDGGRFF